MKGVVRKLIRDEKGKAMALALILLVVGGLILTPLLGLMSTGLVAGQVYEKKTAELYAADAGVENAIWHLQQGGDADDVLTPALNGKDVTVTMEELPGECYDPAIYEIVSTAMSQDDSSTTVTAHVTNIMAYYEGDFTLYEGERIGGHLWVEGTLVLSNDAEVGGNVFAGGDVILNACALIGGIICVGGDLTLNDGASVQSDVYVGGSLTLQGGDLTSWIEGDVHVRENVSIEGGSQILGVVWAGGDIEVGNWGLLDGDLHMRPDKSLDGEKRITGSVYQDYHDEWDCPLELTEPEILLWMINS